VAHPQIAAFARLANGAAQPDRKISGQTTMLARTMHDIRYDAVHDEFVVPNQFGQAILTFHGNAQGEEPPVRVINGPHTQLKRPDRLDIDPVHNEIYVPNYDSIAVFSREATGDAAPIRVIRGPKTGLVELSTLAVDPVNNVIVCPGRIGKEHALLIFNRTDQGDVAPIRAILGATFESERDPQMQIYSPRGWILATSGRGTAKNPASIKIWNIRDNGNVPPRWSITGSKTTLLKPRGIALNPANKEIIVADMSLNSVLTYYFPEMF
jgi:DNA-binding beta-propeller fold protein YncE